MSYRPRSSLPGSAETRFLLFLGACLFVAGCSDRRQDGRYLARVGTAELTAEDLDFLADTSSVTGRSRREAVNEWIVNELLYQEAARRGLTATSLYRRQIDDAKKRLAIAALLDRELFAADDTVMVNDAAVAAAYSASVSDYTLREDVVLASFICFSDRDAANGFRSAVLRGMNWNDAVREAHSDPKTSPLILRTANRQYFTQSTMVPAELWRLTRSLGRDDVSFVLQTGPGNFVVKSHGVKRQGEAPDLDYIRDDIRQRLLITERRARYQHLVEDLRARYGIDVRIGGTEADSGKALE
jgi:hypothetical protein